MSPRPSVLFDGFLPFLLRQAHWVLKPAIVQLTKQFSIGGVCIKPYDGIDAAAGADCRFLVIDPLCDLLERIFIEAMKTRTDLRFRKRQPVSTTLVVKFDQVCLRYHLTLPNSFG
jgi:hypothetical protein